MNLITKTEAGRLLGGEGNPVSISYINQLIARRKLPSVRLSYRVCRIPREAVEAFIAARTIKAA